MKEAILVVYMGGPSSLDEIRPFLFRLFSDRDLINFGVPSFLQRPLAYLISTLRTPKVKPQYEYIGGGSPTVEQSLKQAKEIEKFTGIRTFAGMLYSRPLLEDVAKEIRKFSPGKISVITLYPQYSLATVGACLRDVKRFLGDFNLKVVDSWCRNDSYISWVKKQLISELKRVSSPYVLFSAHSLPKYLIEKGDIYVKEIEDTVNLVMKDIDVPFEISYQSKVGPVEWLEPSTEDTIVKLAKEGIKELVVFPISFVSEHIETLYEIDVEYRKLATKLGIENFIRVKLNPTDRDLIKAMSEEAVGALREER